eukprot:CAMPEP_0194108298 /NCGR_PEP_ID=MMETSP0150-20130528/8026_1 /TAXON_ID=122233 /ORGANISM="Chaetoceros debilis, Strain MM31A-1" /LENGTH=331 /DNA_ID=CAMNT_0038796973 /DNA_START=82 /DNA_END=1077 /DNA_ORIENTATION=-
MISTSKNIRMIHQQHQKKPSRWMLLAIAQSLMWLFVLPIIVRPYWPYIFGSLSPLKAELVLSYTVPSVYIAYSLGMIPVYYLQHPFFEQYKVQEDQPWPWLHESLPVRQKFWALTRRTLKFSSFNLFVLVPILVVAKCHSARMLGIPPMSFRANIDIRVGTDTDETSDYLSAGWPGYSEIIMQQICMTAIHEFGFYASHKMMHVYPFLYKYHKVHHEYKMNNALAAQHNHPIDYILSIAIPGLLPSLIMQPHSFVMFQWFLWTMVANMDDHVGYSFPWSPVRWFPLAALTDEHEFHHSRNVGCFGSKLNVYEKLLDGGNRHYDAWVAKRMM